MYVVVIEIVCSIDHISGHNIYTHYVPVCFLVFHNTASFTTTHDANCIKLSRPVPQNMCSM